MASLVAWGWSDHVDGTCCSPTTKPPINSLSGVPPHRATTDAHLMELAAAHGAKLATLDTGFPGAFLIPAQVAKADDAFRRA